MSMKNYNGTNGNRTSDLPAWGAVPEPTAPRRGALKQVYLRVLTRSTWMYLGTRCVPQLSISLWTCIGAWSHTSTHSYLRHLMPVTPQPLHHLEGAAVLTECETGHAGEEKTLISRPAVDPSAVGYANLQGWDVKALLGSKVWTANCCTQTNWRNFFPKVKGWRPVPVAVWSTAWVCSRSPTEIVGSNPTGDMDVCLLWVLCVVR